MKLVVKCILLALLMNVPNFILIGCATYTYPQVKDKKLVLNEQRLPALAKANTEIEAQQGTATAFKDAKGIEIPKENKWQDRIIGVALAVGAILIVIGIVLGLYGQQPVKGILLACSGIICILVFVVLYASMVWIQENTGKIVLGFSILGAGALGYYFYFSHGTIGALIKGFEVQKNRLWSEEETQKIVKSAQGRFQKHINKLTPKGKR